MRQNIADFHVERFNDSVSRRVNFEFAKVGVDFGELGFGLCYAFGAGACDEKFVTRAGCGEAFIERIGA